MQSSTDDRIDLVGFKAMMTHSITKCNWSSQILDLALELSTLFSARRTAHTFLHMRDVTRRLIRYGLEIPSPLTADADLAAFEAQRDPVFTRRLR